ncbi:FG-GAP repeat domain-containing protein [Streptomyces sp. NPDC000878]
MGRHALRRGGPTALVSATALALLAGALYAFSGPVAGAAEAAVPQASATEITLSEPNSDTPRATQPLVAGETGFLQRQWAVDGLLWTDYADGSTVTVENASGVYTPVAGCTSLGSACHASWYGSDSDLVALPTSLSSASVTLWDPATHKRLVVTSGTGAKYRGLAGDTIVTSSTLINVVDGKRYERTLTGDASYIADYEIVGADSSGVLWARDGDVYYIDLATAVITQVFTDVPSTAHFLQTDDRIGWSTADATRLHLKSRADLTAPEQVFTLPYLAVPDLFQPIAGDPVLVGDWLLLPATKRTGGATLEAASLTDGSTRTLLTSAGDYSIQASGNDAFVTGGTGPADWWTQRVSQDADGSLQLTKTYRIPAEENLKTGLALSRGSLRVVADNPESATDTTSVRTLTTDNGTTLTASAAKNASGALPSCPYAVTACAVMWGDNSDSRPEDVYLQKVSGKDLLTAIGDEWSDTTLSFGTAGGAIVDASDGYVLYNSGGTTPAQYVGEFGQGQKLKRTIRAAALNGPALWSATATSGQLTSYSLTANKTLATVTVPGLGCVPSELQAAGRWVYWACGTASAGVYDTASRKSIAVQPGDVLLGDGFTVRHDHATDELVLTETRTGATRVLASRVPDTGLAADRRYRWTVDEYTGLVAWFDSYEQTHVATTAVAPSNLTVFEAWSESPVSPASPWRAVWDFSRPATSWSLTLTSVQSGPTGRATRTLTGSGTAVQGVSVSWNGKTAGGVYFPNGSFTWTLKATGLGTSTQITVATGRGGVERGSAVRHDFDYVNGSGDLVTLSRSGALGFHESLGRGKFDDVGHTGNGWPTSITAVPFGDLSGDRCNDVLIRLANGALRLYKPGCGATVHPKTAYTTLATSGWTQHDILTSPGDLTGDGRPDLIARKASTGAVYLYKGTSAGKLSGAVALYANWKGYKKIVGAGDLNGDGIGDLLAQDKANNLYRFNGTGRGTFTARTKLFGSWGASYNAVVGAGDITNDGRADLVARDTAGNLYRQSGDGKGSFGARTKIGSGWGTYKSVS